jgi:hypothetical protein
MTPIATKSNAQKFELRNKIGFSPKIRSFLKVTKASLGILGLRNFPRRASLPRDKIFY